MIVTLMGKWGVLALATSAPSGGTSFLDALPDPMKLHLSTVAVVIGVLVVLFFFLKTALFQPLTKLMDDREEAIRTGGSTKATATAMVEARQAEYAVQLKGLRTQAFEHRRALSAAAGTEKQAIVDKARATATTQRAAASVALEAERRAAEAELRAQVDALSESMAQHLLKQA